MKSLNSFWVGLSGPSLGDMSAFATITDDVRAVAGIGDLAAAKVRVADLETAWDDAQPKLQPLNAEAWGYVDGTIDDALNALRAATPDAATVEATLVAIKTALNDPLAGSGAAAGPIGTVSGIAVTDASGRPLPCEVLLGQLRTAMAATTAPEVDRASAADLQGKATERCNADDDARSDAFSAQALALLPN